MFSTLPDSQDVVFDADLSSLANLLCDAGVAFMAMSCDGRLLMMSPALEHILHTRFRAIRADELPAAFHLYDRAGTRMLRADEVPLVRAWHGETVRNEVLSVKVPGQPTRYLRTSAAPRLTAHGDPDGAWAVSTDVTGLVGLVRGEADCDIGVSVNHHLRTPLTMILGHAELLSERTDLAAGAVRSIAAISASARRLDAVADWVTGLVDSHSDHHPRSGSGAPARSAPRRATPRG